MVKLPHVFTTPTYMTTKLNIVIATALLLMAAMPASAQQKPDDAFKNAFLQNINNKRAQGCKCGTTFMPPVAPLTWNDVLANAALGHARDMGEHNYFSHESLDGRTSEQRIMAAGYNFNNYRSFAVGENIAFGQESIDEVMRGWFKSVDHCKNLMNPDFKEIGIAQYDRYWVQDFGGRVPFTAEQQKMIKSGHLKIIRKEIY
jgi:uncharacterized protein YkwD